MHILHHTESGYIARDKDSRQMTLHFQHVQVRLSPRGLVKLRRFLSAIDLEKGQYRPNEKSYELSFSAYPVTLFFDYYEIHEFAELIEEGSVQLDLLEMIEAVGVSLSEETEAS